jgi:hypothetical protein
MILVSKRRRRLTHLKFYVIKEWNDVKLYYHKVSHFDTKGQIGDII